ncbi:MAG: PIN domain-containing protein [Spirochaetota bacterium]
MAWLIDTCLWIEVERGRLGASDISRFTRKEDVFLSPVTISELRFGVEMATDEGIRQARQKSVDALTKKPLILIDERTGAIHGRISAFVRKAGRQADYRVMDLWLAAGARPQCLDEGA